MLTKVSRYTVYTDTSILTTTFVESKLDIVMIKFDFVSYYHLHQMVLFPIAGHNYYQQWRNKTPANVVRVGEPMY